MKNHILYLSLFFATNVDAAKVYITKIYPKIDTTKTNYRYLFDNTKDAKYTDFEENCTDDKNLHVSYSVIDKKILFHISDPTKINALDCYFSFKDSVTWDHKIIRKIYYFKIPWEVIKCL